MRPQILITRARPNLQSSATQPSRTHTTISPRLFTRSTGKYLATLSSQLRRPLSLPTSTAFHPRASLTQPPTMSTTSGSALSEAEQNALIESSKRSAAYQAVKEHMDFSYRLIGIGSGSTVVFVVEALKALGKDITDKMAFFSTGDQSRELIKAAGFRLEYIQDLTGAQQLDVCFDGADEVDEELNLIKGGGACLFQEKLVAAKSKKFVCVAGTFSSLSLP